MSPLNMDVRSGGGIAGMLPASEPRSIAERSGEKPERSKENRSDIASGSMLSIEEKSKSDKEGRCASSVNVSPEKTLTLGSANCSFTIGELVASSMR